MTTKQCECCNDEPATVKVNGWIDGASGLRSGLVAMIGRDTWYAFKGEVCKSCDHDFMMAEGNSYQRHCAWETRQGNFA